MTHTGTETSYDLHLPCLNPNCKSHGKPHPNCRCYPMAEGGEVEHSKLRYCAHGKPHMAGCEYAKDDGRQMYAEGTDEVRPIPGGGITPTPADHYASAAKMYEKAADSLSGATQDSDQATPPAFNAIAGKTAQAVEGQPAPTEDNTQQPPSNVAPIPQQGESADDQDTGQEIDQADQSGADMSGQGQIPGQAQLTPQQAPQSVSTNPDQGAPAQQDADRHMREAAAWANDIDNGHITPKTYNDLFHYNSDGSEKSTLGKVGQLFGLLVAGAGAGLTHQPNAVLQMMDNQIKNDLEAQKQSKSDATNYLRLNQQRLLNDANVKHFLASAAYTDAQKKEVLQRVNQEALTTSVMQGNISAFKAMQKKVEDLRKGLPGTQDAYNRASRRLAYG